VTRGARAWPRLGIRSLTAIGACGTVALALLPAAWQRAAADSAPRADDVVESRADARAAAFDLGRCDFCGVVETVRRIEPGAGAPATFEITVRLRDQSTRTSSNASAGSWRAGDTIMLIGGVTPPRD
jgi:hypothetical protein